MLPATHDLNLSLRVDNALLRKTVALREDVPVSEVLSLAAGAQVIFISTTIYSRELAHVKDRRELWSGVASLFSDLGNCWTDVDSDDLQIQWLRDRLEHFENLAREQKELHVITSNERRKHAADRGASVETDDQCNDPDPDSWEDRSGPSHIYAIGHF